MAAMAHEPPNTSYGMGPYTHSNADLSIGSRTYSGSGPPRTPSPTPSDIVSLNKSVIDLREILNPKRYLKKKYIPWIILTTVIVVLTVLIAIYKKQIVNALTPVSHKLKASPFGWVIPVVILFIISFPPLFGHEIIAILCGVVWGLWVGFGIVALGTYLGEVGNFYAFKTLCSAKGAKLERDSLMYGSLAKCVRTGGFPIALIARLSAIPGHFTTAVFSTCGMGFFTFSAATILSLPKQFITVYIGVILEETGTGTETTKEKIISDTILVISLIITAGAFWWIHKKMEEAKPEVLRDRRRAKARKEWEMYGRSGGSLGESTMALTRERTDGGEGDRDSRDVESVFNPNESDEGTYPPSGNPAYKGGIVEPVSVQPQRWDASGRAIPLLYEQAQGRDSAEVVGWEGPGSGSGRHGQASNAGYAGVGARRQEYGLPPGAAPAVNPNVPKLNPPASATRPTVPLSAPSNSNPYSSSSTSQHGYTYSDPFGPPPGPPPAIAQQQQQQQQQQRQGSGPPQGPLAGGMASSYSSPPHYNYETPLQQQQQQSSHIPLALQPGGGSKPPSQPVSEPESPFLTPPAESIPLPALSGAIPPPPPGPPPQLQSQVPQSQQVQASRPAPPFPVTSSNSLSKGVPTTIPTAPMTMTQPTVPASVPRYQLHDGPMPSRHDDGGNAGAGAGAGGAGAGVGDLS